MRTGNGKKQKALKVVPRPPWELNFDFSDTLADIPPRGRRP